MQCFVIDDSKEFLKVIRARLLKSFAEQVHCQMEFDTAIFELKRLVVAGQIPDIIFVDYNLSEIRNGIDFIMASALISPLSSFVLITDYEDPSVLDKAEALGALHITKRGLSPETFLRVSLHAISMVTKQRTQAITEIGRQRERVFDLSAEIAHEVRNRIGALSHNTKALKIRARNGGFCDDVELVIERYMRKIGETEELCNILVNFSSSKRPSLNRSLVSIADLVKPDRVECKCPVEIEFVGSAADSKFLMDPTVMRSILRNLLENIDKYGGPSVAAKIVISLIQVGALHFLRIEVDDDGPGIPSSFGDSVFEPGERAGKELDYRDGGGLGLGLSFCRNFAAAHVYEGEYGRISLVKEAAASSRFIVEIPGACE